MKSKALIPALLLLAVFVLSFSCANNRSNVIVASGDNETKRVSLSDIRSLTVQSSIDVVYVQADAGSAYAEIHAPKNLIDIVKLDEKSRNLAVYIEMPDGFDGMRTDGKEFYVKVYAPHVTSFVTESAGDLTLEKPLSTSSDVDIESLSSGGIASGDISCASLKVASNSAGNVSLGSVKCGNASISLGSSGDCDVESLDCHELSASTRSAGDIAIGSAKLTSCSLASSSAGNIGIRQLDADKVKADATSAGDITISGSCSVADLSSSSSGNVNAGGLKSVTTVARAVSSGDIICYASGSLDASTGSMGSVKCSGNPAKVKKNGKNITVK